MSRAASRSALLASTLSDRNDQPTQATARDAATHAGAPDSSLLDAWRSHAETRRRNIQAASQSASVEEEEEEAPQAASARWADASGDGRTPTPAAPVPAARAAWDEGGQVEDVRSMLERQQAAAAARRVQLEAQLAKHRQFLDSLSASSLIAQPAQAAAATQPSAAPNTLPHANPPSGAASSSILTSPPPANSYAAAHGSAWPASDSSSPARPVSRPHQLQLQHQQHPSYLQPPHFAVPAVASLPRSPLRRSPTSTSDRSSHEPDSSERFLSSSPAAAASRAASGVQTPQTARSTNSFGYDEFALSENVFVLTEKTHHSRRHSGGGGGVYSRASSGANSRRDSIRDDGDGDDSLRGSPNRDTQDSPSGSTTHSPTHQSSVSPGAAAGGALVSGSSPPPPHPAPWNNQMDAFLSSMLPADPSPGRRQHQHQLQPPQAHRPFVSSPHASPASPTGSTAASASPSSPSHQHQSPSAHNDSLNTSNLSRRYLDGDAADLFALANAGLNKSQQQQQQMRQPQLPQQQFPSDDSFQSSNFDRSHQSQRHPSQQHELPTELRAASSSQSQPSHDAAAPSQSRTTGHSPERSTNSSTHAANLQAQSRGQLSQSQRLQQQRYQQQQQQQQQQQSPPLHPSASLHPADLYDDSLSAPANYTLTEHTRSDQYRPENAAVPNGIPLSRPSGNGNPAARGKSAGGGLGKSMPRSGSTKPRGASAKHSVPILSVTQSVPARAMASVHRDGRHGGSLPRPAVAVPAVSATPFSELYASHMAAAEHEESMRLSARNAEESDEWQHDLDGQEVAEEEELRTASTAPVTKQHQQQSRAHSRTPSLSLTQHRSQPPPPPHPQASQAQSQSKSQTNHHSSDALSSLVGVLDDEAVVEAQLQRIDRALEVQKLRDEIKQLRADSEHRDLFAQYENTIATLQSQNAHLRSRVTKAESAAAADVGRCGSYGSGSPPPVAARAQAQLRTLEHSYKRMSEELASLHEAHAALRKRERLFTFQTRQLHALEARLAEAATAAARREKEMHAARHARESERAATEELKSLLVEVSHKHAAETERAHKHAEQARALRGEVERLAAALHDSKAAAVMQGLAKRPRLPQRSSPALQRFDGLLDVAELESLFLEQRRADAPPNLVNIANRKGLELLTRLRAKVDALHRDHLATQNNEKQLLMLVLKLQEKKAASTAAGANPRP